MQAEQRGEPKIGIFYVQTKDTPPVATKWRPNLAVIIDVSWHKYTYIYTHKLALAACTHMNIPKRGQGIDYNPRRTSKN